MKAIPVYFQVFATFARNSLVRDMTFRTNFIIQTLTSVVWMSIQLSFYAIVLGYTDEIGRNTGWTKYPFYTFIATTMLVNGLMQALVMRNAEEFSELIRTGRLDFALLKPIDTQFLISFHRIEWSSLTNFAYGLVVLGYSLVGMGHVPNPIEIVLYIVYVLCGVAIMYSLIICLAATSVWMGRNQSLYDFWFYITTFSRYPMEIYKGPIGRPLAFAFTFVIPIMLAMNIPARIMAFPLADQNWPLILIGLAATIGALIASRFVFKLALAGYRSASS
ncbi:MAG: ABC transporter permease [Phycisphaeraceae bacterium]|nr:ABC transporter permease [Phycisphaeraceae bacterium]